MSSVAFAYQSGEDDAPFPNMQTGMSNRANTVNNCGDGMDAPTAAMSHSGGANDPGKGDVRATA